MLKSTLVNNRCNTWIPTKLDLFVILRYCSSFFFRLLGKLDHYGIEGKIITRISKFFEHHKQCVVVDGEFSSYATIYSEVPQGTVLGPRLFLLHIDYLPLNIEYSKVQLFADDCLLHKKIKTHQDQIDFGSGILGLHIGYEVQCQYMWVIIRGGELL